MEETLVFRKMTEIDLITNLEKISSRKPDRVLKLEGYTLQDNQKERLEIIIFKGFSSSTTHPIETDLEKKIIKFDFILTNFKLYEGPLSESKKNLIRESQKSVFFLNQKNWI